MTNITLTFDGKQFATLDVKSTDTVFQVQRAAQLKLLNIKFADNGPALEIKEIIGTRVGWEVTCAPEGTSVERETLIPPRAFQTLDNVIRVKF